MFATSAMPHTHDGPVHLARLGAYVKALEDGQIVPRWAGTLNYGYGTPLFIFIYQLPYAIASAFVLLGFGLVMSFKLLLATSFLLSGVFMYLFAKAFFKNDRTAFVVALFYQFAPFRFVELFIRGSIGEIYTYTFTPLVLYGIIKTIENPSYQTVLLLVIATALLVLSHNSISLVFFAVCLLFLLFMHRSIKNSLLAFSGLLGGLALSAFYWMPALLEHKYTYGDLFMKEVFRKHFPPLVNFFLPNLNNTGALQTGGVPVQFGLFHEIAIALALWAILKNKGIPTNLKKITIFSLTLIFVTLFFMQPISTVFWEKVTLLRQFQFPWRLLATIVLASSLLSAYYVSFLKKWTNVGILMVLVVLTSVYYWNPPLGVDRIDEQHYWDYPLNATYYGEADVIWAAGPAPDYPKERIQVVAGNAQITDLSIKSNRHSYNTTVNADATVVDHTLYFPGWRVYVDGVKTPVEFQNQLFRGLLTYQIPKGMHSVKVIFEESKVRTVADAISIVFLVALIGGFFLPKKIFRP